MKNINLAGVLLKHYFAGELVKYNDDEEEREKENNCGGELVKK